MSKITLYTMDPADIAFPPSGARTVFLNVGTGAFASMDSSGTVYPFEQVLSDNVPSNIGTAAAGTGTSASRYDHVHAHGNQVGGTLHDLATVGTAGFMSAADKTALTYLYQSTAANRFWGSPDGSAGVPTMRALVAGDHPASLSAIFPLTPAADRLPYYTSASAGALATFTAMGRSIVAAATAAAAATVIGLGTGDTPAFTGLTLTNPLGVTYGGTGFASYAVGDLLYAATTTTLAKLADVATGNALISGGVTTAPSWGKVGLTTHISGVLAEGNGGTNQSAYTTGDLLHASASNTLSKLAAVATGNVLISGGVATASSWGKVALTTHVSGILPLANGGSGADLSATGGSNQFVKQVTLGGVLTVAAILSADLTSALTTPPVIGGTTPAAITAAALTATGAVALSPGNANVVLSPTGTGLVTINPATAGTLNNVVIGGSTPLAATFTTVNGTTITSTVQFLAADGSAGTPSISLTNAATSGFYKAGTNIIGISTAGTARGVIDASGRLVLGTTAGIANTTGVIAFFQNHGTGGSGQNSLGNWATSALGPVLVGQKSRGGGTVGTHGVVVASDVLFDIMGEGSDGAAFVNAAKISFIQAGAIGSSIVPAQMRFFVMNTAGTLAEAMRIHQSARVLVGTTTDDGATTLQVGGPFIATTGSFSSTLGVTGILTSSGGITMADAKNIIFNTSTGSQIATGSTQKMGLWGATPIVRGTAFTQTYSTATHTIAARAASAITDNSGGVSGYPTIAVVTNPTFAWNGIVAPTAAEGTAINTAITAIKAAIAALAVGINNVRTDDVNSVGGLNGLIDDLQAWGFTS